MPFSITPEERVAQYKFGLEEIEVELPCPGCGEMTKWYYRKPYESVMGGVAFIDPRIECSCKQRKLYE